MAPRPTSQRINRKKFTRWIREARGELNVGFREGDWKSIWNADEGELELYDLASDPLETKNLVGRHPDRAVRLAGLAKDWLERCEPAPSEDLAPFEIPEAEQARLRALGYLD